VSAPAMLSMPASLETEAALIGTLLIDPRCIYEAVSKLRPDDFSSASFREIFGVIASMSDRREPIDTRSLCETLKAQGRLQACGGEAIIGELTSTAVRRSSVAYHCGVIKEKSVMRQYCHLAELMMAQSLDPLGKSKDVAATIQEAILETQTTGAEFRKMAEVMTEAVERLSEYRNMPDIGTIGLTTTLDDIDTATSGIRESEFWVIGARPNVGKTPFGMQVAISQARKNIPVLVFSLEMQDTQIACRCLAHAGIAKPRHVRDPRFAGAGEWSSIIQAPDIVSDWPMWIDDTPGLTLRELRHKARYAVAKYGVRLIIVDYLGLVQSPGKSEYEKVTATASGLRLLARETKCPILSLCQLNREAKDLTKEPTLGDLRSSGEIEQSANVVGLLHRPPDPQYGNEMLGSKGLMIMAKVREGIGGKVDVTFDRETLTFMGGWR
jgi:replicative DNA helicase